MNAKLKIGGTVVAIAAIAFAYTSWQSAKNTATVIAMSIPEIPNTANLHSELVKRIQDSDTKSKAGSNTQEALEELSRLYHANGFAEQAMQAYQGLMAIDPKNPTWPYRAADILAGYGRLDEASPLFQRAIDLDERYIPSYIRLGDTLLKLNSLEEARTAFSAGLEQDTENVYAMVGLARVAIAKEDWDAARIQLEKAVKFSNLKIGGDLLGDVYANLGLKAKEQTIRENLSWGSYADILDPRMTVLMDDCYDAYQVSIAGGWMVHEGDTRNGLRYIKRAVSLEPENPKLQYQIAGVYKTMGNLELAKEHYQRCVELQPDFSDGWFSLVNIAKTQQSPTALRRALEKGLENCPNSPSLNIEMGEQLLNRKQISKAIPYFKHAIVNRPHEAGPYIALSKAYIAADLIPDAVEQMKLALIAEPGNPIALSTLVFSSIMENDKAAADEWIEKLKLQDRVKDKEIQTLARQYQQTFGTRPNL